MLYGYRVLAIDDDRDALRLYAELLGAQRADLRVAADGEAALDLVRPTWVPHAVLVHVNLPDMHAVELADAVNRKAGVQVGAVAVTGDARPATRQAVLDGGFDACLVKPIEPETLVRAVATAAAGARGRGR